MAVPLRAMATGTETPFIRARREWDDRFRGLAAGQRHWRLLALALVAVNTVLGVSLAWLSTRARITPYVVEVDRLGHAAAFGPAEELRRTDERLIRYQLGMYLQDLRTVVGDEAAQKELLTRAYAYTRGAAVAFLNEHFSTDNPFAVARLERVRIRLQSILPLSERTWQVQWLETRTDPSGRQIEELGWRALLTLEIDPPKTTEALLLNPLGLYVTDIRWTPTLEGGNET